MKRSLLFILVITLIFAAACQDVAPGAVSNVTPAPATEPAAAEPTAEPDSRYLAKSLPLQIAPTEQQSQSITPEVLKNATYGGIYEEPVTLIDGLYEGEPFTEGDPSRPTVEYIDGAELYGDINVDSLDDAVVFLRESTGGTAVNYYLAAQINQDGEPADAGSVLIDSNIEIIDAAIEEGQVMLAVTTRGPGDADCCASYRTTRTFVLEDGKLTEIGDPSDPVRVSAADLDGTSWTLVEIDGAAPAETETAISLSFEDGRLVGSGGCNNYISSFNLGEDNPFVMSVGPVASLHKECPDPISSQETAYFSALESVSGWGYLFGQLALYHADDQNGGLSRLLFSPAAAEGPLVESPADAGLPSAEIANDEGGSVTVNGEWSYTSSYVGRHYTEPVAILMDVSDVIQRNYTEWVPTSGQIMGVLTRPLAPSPTAYAVNLPVEPSGKSIDLDNDGQADAGVQILTSVISSNLAGDSYLEQIEQDGFTSYLKDPQTGAIRQGSFLVYAPDDQQGFPSGAGDDGIFFTEDDPAVALPAGYTHVTLTEEGQVIFDRSRKASMPILEAASFSSPDFSDQGILESYESLIAMLKERYSYTDLRGLDWDGIREEFLPAVEAADEADDFAAYYAALNKMALSVRDAHVYVNTLDSTISAGAYAEFDRDYAGTLGARMVELSDGRFVVIYVAPDSPAAEAGWQFGTEIVSVGGVPIAERVEALPIFESAGNPEVIRLKQTNIALNFPVGAETIIEYRQPDDEELQTANLTADAGLGIEVPGPTLDDESIGFKTLEDGTYYIQWKMFDDELYKIAVLEKFLEQAQGAPGVIIDMRHNGGGSVTLLYTMASYFFSDEEPAALHWLDEYTYDDQAGDLVQQFATDYPLSSPKPDLTYSGALAVLVGPNSASAAEYMPQFLQQQGRAIVVGEHSTEGAGGAVEFVTMPGGFTFLFTKGRSYFAGTDELNLEAKGINLDERVPITLENELAKQEGRDVVLEAALEVLREEAARLASETLLGTTWQLTDFQEVLVESSSINKEEPDNPAAYTISFGDDGQITVQADCNTAAGAYALGGGTSVTISINPTTLVVCPEGSISENFLDALGAVNSVQTDGSIMALSGIKENGDIVTMFLQKSE